MNTTPRGGRLRRYSRRTLKGAGGLIAVVALLVVAFLASLDTPFLRARVRALVKLPIDWHHTQLSLSNGVVLRGFSIANEPPYDRYAPNLLEVDRIEVTWSLAKLLRGKALAERVAISGAQVAVVIDEAGQTSLAGLAGAPTEPLAKGSPTPRSRALAALGERLPIEHATIRDARLRLVQLTAQGPRELVAALDAEASLPSLNEAAATLRLRLISQDLVPAMPHIDELIALETRASFRPTEQRVLVEIAHLRGLDGALAGDGQAELSDDGLPFVTKARIAVNSRSIQAALDHDGSPLSAEGTLSVRVERLRLGALPHLEPGGALELEAKLARLALSRAHGLELDGDSLELDVSLRTPTLAGSALADAASGIGHLALKLGHLTLHHGGFAMTLGGVALQAELEGIAPYAHDLLATARSVRTRGKIDRFEVRPGALSVTGESVALDAELKLPGKDPGALRIDAPIRALSLSLGKRAIVSGEPAQLHVGLSEARYDRADPLASEGKERSLLRVGPLTLRSRIDKSRTDAVAFELDVDATRLSPLVALVQLPAGVSLPWAEIGAHLHTKGRISGLRRVATIALEAQTDLDLERPSLRGGALPISARHLGLKLSSRGSLLRHRVELALRSDQLLVASEALLGPTLRATIELDRTRPTASLDLTVEGGAAPAVDLSVALGFARPGRALTARLKLRASRLGLLGRLLPRSLTQRHRLAWDQLTLELEGKLDARGAVVGWDELEPRLALDPLESARGEGGFRLVLRGLDYQDHDSPLALAADTIQLDGELRAADGDAVDARPMRHGRLSLAVDQARARVGEHVVVLNTLAPVLSLEARGAARAPELLSSLDAKLGKLVQDYYPAYPVGQLTLGATLRSDSQGLLRMERFALENRSGGSRVALKGGLDLAAPLRKAGVSTSALLAAARAQPPSTVGLPGRVGLDVEIELEQVLGAFPIEEGLVARGTLSLPIHLQSADLHLFTLHGLLGLSDVALQRGDRFGAEGLRGLIPISLELELEQRLRTDGTTSLHLRPVAHPEGVSFPRTHYTEHQPFLAQRSFFAADKLRIGELALGPLAGNLSIDNTHLELGQLEAVAARGRVHGQLSADLAGVNTRIAFRGDVTGLMPPRSRDRDDRLDANLALVIEPFRLSLEGRAELVHISRALLLDLLEAWDPYHAELNANRARLALKLGYPKQVRLAFDHGFAALKLELGGLTRLVRVDEIRGVPIGPLLERYLAASLHPFQPTPTVATRAPEESSP